MANLKDSNSSKPKHYVTKLVTKALCWSVILLLTQERVAHSGLFKAFDFSGL